MERHAAEAALEYIHDDMTIGLGSGRAVQYLVEFISMANFSNLKIVTNRMDTALLAKKRGLTVIPCWMADKLDYAFDDLDYVVKDMSGAKTQGAIVVEDKLLACMADTFIEMVDKAHFVDVISDVLPVLIEVSKPALSYTQARLTRMGAQVVTMDPKTGLPSISPEGNYIIQAGFRNPGNLKELNAKICNTPGVVSTSLYTGKNSIAIVYDKDTVETFEG